MSMMPHLLVCCLSREKVPLLFEIFTGSNAIRKTASRLIKITGLLHHLLILKILQVSRPLRNWACPPCLLDLATFVVFSQSDNCADENGTKNIVSRTDRKKYIATKKNLPNFPRRFALRQQRFLRHNYQLAFIWKKRHATTSRFLSILLYKQTWHGTSP